MAAASRGPSSCRSKCTPSLLLSQRVPTLQTYVHKPATLRAQPATPRAQACNPNHPGTSCFSRSSPLPPYRHRTCTRHVHVHASYTLQAHHALTTTHRACSCPYQTMLPPVPRELLLRRLTRATWRWRCYCCCRSGRITSPTSSGRGRRLATPNVRP